MRSIIAWSLRYPILVVALAIALIVLGIQVTHTSAYDAFPEFAPPRVEIQTEAPGYSAEEIEQLVTIPIENVLTGTSGLAKIRSKSVSGLSSVLLLFEYDADLLQARALVQERLDAVTARLPRSTLKPVILQPMSSTSRALKIGVRSDSLDRMQLSELALWTIRPRLMAIPGVANVAVWGQRSTQLQVRVDTERLQNSGVTATEIVAAARRAVSIDAGGFVDTTNQRIAVQVDTTILTPAQLASQVLRSTNGVVITIGDVADVQWDHPPPIGDAIIDDVPGLLLIVEKLPWGNTLDITHDVETAIEALRPGLGDVHIDSTIFRPATFITEALDNLGHTMLIGCGLVVAVLIAFLFDWYAACISLIAIPLSISAALVILHWFGTTINTMTLAGLVIALGEVVDDAIIDVENIGRRLAERRERGDQVSPFQVVLDASLEVRSAVVFGSIIIVLVFIPIFFLDGLAGAFFRPLTIAYVIAILASLLVALTVTPALSLMLLGRGRARAKESPLVRVLTHGYRSILPRVLAFPRTIAIAVVALLIATVFTSRELQREFLPHFRERDFLMHWVEKPATGIEAMSRITQRVSKELRAVPGVRNFGSHIGRAEVADEVVGPNFTELWISIDPSVDYESTVARVQEIVDGYPGLQRDLLTYLRERVKEVLTGAGASIVVRIIGPELTVLRDKANEIASSLADVPGVADLHVEQQQLIPRVSVRVRTDAAKRFGIDPATVRGTVALLLRGEVVGEVRVDQKIRAAVVTGTDGVRSDVEGLREWLIEIPGGGHVALGEIADISVVPTQNVVQREDASRKIDITCNVRGEDLGTVASAIGARVAKAGFPLGYHADVLGEFDARQKAQDRLLSLALASLIGIVLLLHADFRSWRLTLLVVASLPFALIGGVVGAFADHATLSLGSMVGFVTVLGIAARNGILLISHYRHLEEHEGMTFGRELVLRGACERLSPILMTATCAALALLPLTIGPELPGQEIERPMAFVIVGGLVSSTLLSVFVLPAFYYAFGQPRSSKGTMTD